MVSSITKSPSRAILPYFFPSTLLLIGLVAALATEVLPIHLYFVGVVALAVCSLWTVWNIRYTTRYLYSEAVKEKWDTLQLQEEILLSKKHLWDKGEEGVAKGTFKVNPFSPIRDEIPGTQWDLNYYLGTLMALSEAVYDHNEKKLRHALCHLAYLEAALEGSSISQKEARQSLAGYRKGREPLVDFPTLRQQLLTKLS